jgi:hypothetical protein
MKGLMFNLFEEVVARHIDGDAWDWMLDSAGLEGAYTSLGNYPDEEFTRLVAALSRKIGRSEHDSLAWFGQRAIPFLAERLPEFFAPHRSLRSFLLSLNDVIHAEVRKLYAGADVPVFQFESPAGERNVLLIQYRSKRRLCPLAEGFIAGAADHFRERVSITQAQCMLQGAPACTLVCRFEGQPDA